MTSSLIVGLLVVALVDSVNPSALVVTTALLRGGRPYARSTAYVAGIFMTYFAVGVAVLLGAGEFFTTLTDLLRRPAVTFTLQALVGTVLTGFAVLRLTTRERTVDPQQTEQSIKGSGLAGAFLTGVAVTAVEATTALPYLGALAALSRAGLDVSSDLLLLLTYNLVFVAPPVALVLLHRSSPARSAAALNAVRRSLGRLNNRLTWAVTLVLGAVLVVDAAVNLAGL